MAAHAEETYPDTFQLAVSLLHTFISRSSPVSRFHRTNMALTKDGKRGTNCDREKVTALGTLCLYFSYSISCSIYLCPFPLPFLFPRELGERPMERPGSAFTGLSTHILLPAELLPRFSISADRSFTVPLA